MITLKNIQKTYIFFNAVTKKRSIIHIGPFDLEVAKGEFVVLVGPSGCGKSTTLRMVAGLEKIDQGELLIDQNRINEVAPGKRGVAMVFQDYGLYPHFTIKKNLSFYLELQKIPANIIEEKIKIVSQLLGLSEQLEKKPAQLSGGQRQRVAIGRCLVRECPIWLFDEPLGALDAQMRDQMRTEIKRLHQSKKMTILYVTHDQHEAMSLADKLVIMNAGQIEQVGTPLDIFEHPKNIFVAKFLGSPQINLLENVHIQHRESGFVAVGNNNCFILPLKEEKCKKLFDGQIITLGIRPYDIHSAKENGYSTRIEIVETLGKNMHLTISLGIYNLIMDVANNQSIPVVGSNKKVVFDIDKVYLFNAQTEENLCI